MYFEILSLNDRFMVSYINKTFQNINMLLICSILNSRIELFFYRGIEWRCKFRIARKILRCLHNPCFNVCLCILIIRDQIKPKMGKCDLLQQGIFALLHRVSRHIVRSVCSEPCLKKLTGQLS